MSNVSESAEPIAAPKLAKVNKRDGRPQTFNPSKIEHAMKTVFYVTKTSVTDEELDEATNKVIEEVQGYNTISVSADKVANAVKNVLREKWPKAYDAYVIYRANRDKVLATKNAIIKNTPLLTTVREITDDKFTSMNTSNILRDNANECGATPAGAYGKIASETNKTYNLLNNINEKYAQMHKDGYMHIHDLNMYNLTFNCLFAPIGKLLATGFDSGTGFIRRAHSVQSAAALTAVIFQLQSNQQYGGIACDNFDFDLAPSVDESFRTHLGIRLNDYYEDTGDEKFKDFAGDPEKDEDKERWRKLLSDVTMNKPICHYTDRFPKKCLEKAIKYTNIETHQAMEALVHNLNSLQSRSGNQVPFSSINFGLDTSNCGRMVSHNLMRAQYEGMGDGLTPIFPILIFKLMKGYTKYEGDPNYDLYLQAIECLCRRFYPNFVRVDSSFNRPYIRYEYKEVEDANPRFKYRGRNEEFSFGNGDYKSGEVTAFEYDAGNGDYWEVVSKTGDKLKIRKIVPNSTIATMGCRTRVIGNINGPEQTTARGNFAFHTLNLPRIAIEAHIKSKNEETRKQIFFEKLDELLACARESLLDRYNFICNSKTYENFPFTMQQGLYLTSDDKVHALSDSIAEVMKQSTLSIGYIGIAEVVTLLTGKTYGVDHDIDDFALSIVKHIREFCDTTQKETHLNWSCFATPAEAVAGRFASIDKNKFCKEVIEGPDTTQDGWGDDMMTGCEGHSTPKMTDDDYVTGCECAHPSARKKKIRLVGVKGLEDVDLMKIFGKGYYTNSHMMYFSLDTTLENKINTEAPFHKITNAGHIFYYKVDGDPTKNTAAVKACIDAMYEGDLGYFTITFNQDTCLKCGFHGIIDNACPKCGCTDENSFVRVRRITGYLTGAPKKTILKSWNDGKLAELNDRHNI
jgi:ribonucleoside-triphosphate reductase